MDNRRIAEAYIHAAANADLEGLAAHMHPDIVVHYPQSGEIIRGRDNYVAMLSNWPGGLPPAEMELVEGEGQEVQVSTPLPFSIPTVTVRGSGDHFVAAGIVHYPDGGVFHFVSITKVHEGLVAEETSYFGAPFAAPDWRKPFVEPRDDG